MVDCLVMVDDYLQKALALQKMGDHKSAEKAFKVMLQKAPNDPDALHLFGLSLHAQGRLKEAAEKIASAIKLLPGQAMFHTHAGVVAVALGDFGSGRKHYQTAIECDPEYVDAYSNFGVLLDLSGHCEEALVVLNQGLALDEKSVNILVNRGKVLVKLGRDVEAEASYRAAIELNSGIAEAHNNLGNLLKRQKRYDEAATSFKAALTARPGFLDARYNWALSLAGTGKVEEADDILARLIGERPQPHFFIARAGLMQAIPSSSEDIELWRQRFEEGFDALYANRLKYSGDPLSVPVMNFYLAYHGKNDRPLMEKLSEFWRQACPSLNYISDSITSASSRRRVGFFSRYLKNHAVGYTLKGLLEGLVDKAGDEIEVALISLADGEDKGWESLKLRVSHSLALPHDLISARKVISELKLDVLIYTDIGMDPFSYYLSFARLAPIQCVLWGHPVTSGVSTIDYYISSDKAEPCKAQDHYTEQLIRLGGVQTCYQRPITTDNLTRREANLPENCTLYMCPQSLFKIHPDMDQWLARLIKADTNSRLVIFEGNSPTLTSKLISRWLPIFGNALDRVIVLKRTDWNGFLAILSLGDVILDTWPFGGGNTNYQAFGFGLPVVTLPGEFVRGLGAKALYEHMGIFDCIADSPEDYVNIALNIGQKEGLRSMISSKILERSDLIFNDTGVIEDFIKFLRSVSIND